MEKEDLAYIAGFLDGDGCIMLQLIFRHDYVLGYQIRASVVFYQKQQYVSFLEQLKSRLMAGYIRVRNDGMAEYTIVGPKPVYNLLKDLQPYLQLKRRQADLALSVLAKMPTGRAMNAVTLLKLAGEIDEFAQLNYSKKRTNTSLIVKDFLQTHNLLDPVETDP